MENKEEILSFFKKHGISGSYKFDTIIMSLLKRIQTTQSQNEVGYFNYVQNHPEEIDNLKNELSICVTRFYRDLDTFSFIKEILKVYLNNIQVQKVEENKILNLWSAGCANGAELYSIAILLKELLGQKIQSYRIKISATDINSELINGIKSISYREEELRELTKDKIRKYFTLDSESNYVVNDDLNDFIKFQIHDLTQNDYLRRQDVIFCRYVTMYFMESEREIIFKKI